MSFVLRVPQLRFHTAFGLTTQIEHHLFPGIGGMAA